MHGVSYNMVIFRRKTLQEDDTIQVPNYGQQPTVQEADLT